MKQQILGLALLLCAGCATPRSTTEAPAPREGAAISMAPGRSAAAIYVLRSPEGANLPMPTGGYFHPVYTPAGEVLTDFAPDDHKHHRGIFLAWVEMHGAKSADFWGWGEHAPIKDREIRNVAVRNVKSSATEASFQADNVWVADGVPLIDETLYAELDRTTNGTVLDLEYRLTPQANMTVAQWAFSGFCLRVRKDGQVQYHSPKGVVTLPNPSHTNPASDWPDERWYAAQITLPEGKSFGGAVLSHPDNPPTVWHNHRDVRMINPCIVAQEPLRLQKGKTLVLRYRVVAFDGAPPLLFLNSLAREWGRL